MHTGMHKRFRNKQVIGSIIYSSRSGMSVVAFRTALPIGGLSCFVFSDTSSAINFRIHCKIPTNGLDISKRNDVANCFWLTANHINRKMLDHIQAVISQ